ncbi:hypothetical protein ES705_46240 [subsurface metagenome]
MPKIMEMYAFVTEDKSPDDEGVVAAQNDKKEWMPLMGADLARAQSVKPIAQNIADVLGKKVTLLRFTNREEVEVLYPLGKPR